MTTRLHLVTSEIDPKLPELLDDAELEKVVFLGHEVLSQKVDWDQRVLARCWSNPTYDDRDLLHKLSADSTHIYSVLLDSLADAMATVGAVSGWDRRSWAIFLGPWLRTFVFSAQLHEHTLGAIRQEFEISSLTAYSNSWAPPVNTRSWLESLQNGSLHVSLLGDIGTALGIRLSASVFDSELTSAQRQSKRLDSLPSQILGIEFRRKRQRYFLNATYLGYVRERLLEVALGQFPSFPANRGELEVGEPNEQTRARLASLLLASLPKQVSPSLLGPAWWAKNLAKYIPISLLEAQGKYLDATTRIWPSKPITIFDSNGYWADDIFKIYTAEKASKESRLVLGQHGGSFGYALRSLQQDHMIEVADYFISWGWDSSTSEKVLPIGRLKPVPKAQPGVTGDIILPLADFPGYPYDSSSMPIGRKASLEYIDDQISFAKFLAPRLRQRLHIRLYAKDRGNLTRDRLEEAGIGEVENADTPLSQRLKGGRICVVTYNSTIFLETLAANFPTVCFWRSHTWEILPEFEAEFEKLVKVGILHRSPESAAKFLNTKWERISEWWQGEEVQAARSRFVSKFSKQLNLQELSTTLGRISFTQSKTTKL